MRKRLTRRETKWREEIIVSVWAKYKSEMIMSELANIFKMELADAYRILRGGSNKEKIAKGENYLNKK